MMTRIKDWALSLIVIIITIMTKKGKEIRVQITEIISTFSFYILWMCAHAYFRAADMTDHV
jgi:hypothetical protein